MNGGAHLMVFDVETTGLPKTRNGPYTLVDNWPRVVSICWIITDASRNTAEEYYTIVKPDGYTIPQESVRIHGISMERALSQGVPLDDVFLRLGDVLKKYKVGSLVAHNADFDRNVLFSEMHRRSHPLLGELQKLGTICTKESATNFCAIPAWGGRYKWPTLEELHSKLFGQSPSGQHNARHDAQATLKCFFKLVDLRVIRSPF